MLLDQAETPLQPPLGGGGGGVVPPPHQCLPGLGLRELVRSTGPHRSDREIQKSGPTEQVGLEEPRWFHLYGPPRTDIRAVDSPAVYPGLALSFGMA
jgi:hypothetical protein